MAGTGKIVALIKALAPGVDPSVIEQAVTDWLDDHPEATTTVEDGSITEEKLASDVLADLAEIEELKEAIAILEPTASASDVGKFLKAKTVEDGKVTEYEFGSGGGGGGVEIDDTAGHGDTTVVWSAGKTSDEIAALESPYRLIKEITLDEATASVVVDKDQYGESFSLKEVVVDFNLTAGSGSSNGGLIPNSEQTSGLNGIPYLCIANLYNTTAQRRVAKLDVRGGMLFGQASGSTLGSHYTTAAMQSNLNASGIYQCGQITKLKIFSLNNHSLGSESVITIYGR